MNTNTVQVFMLLDARKLALYEIYASFAARMIVERSTIIWQSTQRLLQRLAAYQ